MCGFAGVLHLNNAVTGVPPGEAAHAMANTLAHRGPDDFKVWHDQDAGIGLGFRRLAILDLSTAGAQPMASQCGRYVIAYNGEIYNHLALRTELERQGVSTWRGHSDTEVLLAAITHWGVDKTLAQIDGMFAFALWDKQDRRLSLARDPFGEKPLYYGVQNGVLVFGSELKAIMACPGFTAKMDTHATALFLRHRYVPAPHSILDGIHKLPAGHLVSVTANDTVLDAPRPYWDSFNEALKAQESPFAGSFENAVEALDELLSQSVAQRRVADVPVGVFLSGGIDSSLIAALMSRAGGDVHSYTIGFDEGQFDESPYARAVAQHLGTKYSQTILSQDDALAVVPKLAEIYDEPFADA
ncbi:MAG: asparagine synthase (glutamine-hydrolyzing), partial [Magnetovibrio sp.]|nr:asparagine synthase (glutamine-hydrolyzing) [Magnetovibrio sp.]